MLPLVQMKLLKEALACHWQEVEEASKSVQDVFEQYTVMNPQFLLEIAKQHMNHSGTEPLDPASSPNAHLVEGTKLLTYLVEQVPGMLEAQLLLATSQYLQRDFTNAVRTLNMVREPPSLRPTSAGVCPPGNRVPDDRSHPHPLCLALRSACASMGPAVPCTCCSHRLRCTATTCARQTSPCSGRSATTSRCATRRCTTSSRRASWSCRGNSRRRWRC